jgi:hypothetical protein
MATVFKEDWAAKMQQRLSEATKWKDFMRVEISNTRTLHNPYRTDVTVAALTRYTAYTPAAVAQTDESITIDASFVAAEIIDRADLAQSGYLSQMESADNQGALLNEKIESYIYSQYAQLTTFDGTKLGGSGNITVSAANIDTIITGIVREISKAKGDALLEKNGAFIVWRPADYELLQQFMMANGFVTADNALRDGVGAKIDYMGVTHFKSNLLTAGHLVAGVKKLWHLGILKDTYGQIVVNEKDPGLISGVGITSRLDLKVKAWTKTVPVLFNIAVA